MTGPSRGIYNFVIKNGEVEGKAEPDRVRRLHFRLRNVKRLLVRLLRILDYRCNANQPLFRLHLPRPRFFFFSFSSLSFSLLPRNHRSNKSPASSKKQGEGKDERKLDKREGKRERVSTIPLAFVLQRAGRSYRFTRDTVVLERAESINRR